MVKNTLLQKAFEASEIDFSPLYECLKGNTPRDNTTCYFYDMLSKGTHVIETEYYIDRAGTYETGTATVECAYSPEFRAVTHSETLNIKD